MEQVNVTLTETIKLLLDDKKFSTLRDILITMKPFDIAAVFENLQDEKMPILFRILPKELAAETFVEMDDETQEFLIHGFSDSELKEVVDELFVDDAVDLIEEMPANVVKRILRQADKDMRKQINELLKYPEDSAGSIMTTEFIVLRPDMTAEMAIKRIRRTGVDKETIYTCYVTAVLKLVGICTEGVCVHNVRSGINIPPVKALDKLGVSNVQHLRHMVVLYTAFLNESSCCTVKQNKILLVEIFTKV